MNKLLKSLTATTIAVTIGPIAAFSAVAQPAATDTTFEAQTDGIVVDLGKSGDAEFTVDDYDYADNGSITEEYIWFASGSSNYQIVLVGGDLTAQDYYDVTVENMESYYDSFEIIDESVSDDSAMFIADAELSSGPVSVVYDYEVDAIGDIDVLEMQFSLPEYSADEITWAQDNVTVDGDAMFPNVDGDDITAARDGGSSNDDEDVEDEATQEPTEEEEEDSSSGSGSVFDRLSSSSSQPDEEDADAEATAASDDSDDSSSSSDLGLVSESEWESQIYDHTIEWGPEWQVSTLADEAVVVNEDDGWELLALDTTDGNGMVYINTSTENGKPRDYIEYWESAEYLESLSDDAEVVLTDTSRTGATAVIQFGDTNGDTQVMVVNVTLYDDGSAVLSRVAAYPEGIVTVMDQYESVEVDGQPIDLIVTSADVEDAINP